VTKGIVAQCPINFGFNTPKRRGVMLASQFSKTKKQYDLTSKKDARTTTQDKTQNEAVNNGNGDTSKTGLPVLASRKEQSATSAQTRQITGFSFCFDTNDGDDCADELSNIYEGNSNRSNSGKGVGKQTPPPPNTNDKNGGVVTTVAYSDLKPRTKTQRRRQRRKQKQNTDKPPTQAQQQQEKEPSAVLSELAATQTTQEVTEGTKDESSSEEDEHFVNWGKTAALLENELTVNELVSPSPACDTVKGLTASIEKLATEDVPTRTQKVAGKIADKEQDEKHLDGKESVSAVHHVQHHSGGGVQKTTTTKEKADSMKKAAKATVSEASSRKAGVMDAADIPMQARSKQQNAKAKSPSKEPTTTKVGQSTRPVGNVTKTQPVARVVNTPSSGARGKSKKKKATPKTLVATTATAKSIVLAQKNKSATPAPAPIPPPSAPKRQALGFDTKVKAHGMVNKNSLLLHQSNRERKLRPPPGFEGALETDTPSAQASTSDETSTETTPTAFTFGFDSFDFACASKSKR
jgi:hypothetical protein